MIPMTLSRIAEIVGGTLHDVDDPSTQVTGTVECGSGGGRRCGGGASSAAGRGSGDSCPVGTERRSERCDVART
jgi:hypothetical protein